MTKFLHYVSNPISKAICKFHVDVPLNGTLPYYEAPGGGVGPHIKFGGKIWASSDQVHQIRGKPWEILLLLDAKVGEKS